MKPKIQDANNINYLTKTAAVLKKSIQIWYKLMIVMKSKNYHTEENIEQFKENTIELTKAIQNLITTPTVPVCILKHSRQLKSHLLFDGEIYEFLAQWKTLGALDKQHTKGVHPKFNNLLR